MLSRVAVVVCACIFGVVSAMAEELGPEQAKAFVVGKLFAYTCFDGTAGMGRIFADGSVVGTIRPGGRGEVRAGFLGALVLATVSNGLNTAGYKNGTIYVVTGAILLLGDFAAVGSGTACVDGPPRRRVSSVPNPRP